MEGIDVYSEEGQFEWGLRLFWRVGFAMRLKGTKEHPVVQKIDIEAALREIERARAGEFVGKKVVERYEDFGTLGLLTLREKGVFRL